MIETKQNKRTLCICVIQNQTQQSTQAHLYQSPPIPSILIIIEKNGVKHESQPTFPLSSPPNHQHLAPNNLLPQHYCPLLLSNTSYPATLSHSPPKSTPTILFHPPPHPYNTNTHPRAAERRRKIVSSYEVFPWYKSNKSIPDKQRQKRKRMKRQPGSNLFLFLFISINSLICKPEKAVRK